MAMTDDLSDAFFTKVKAMATALGCAPEDLLKVWFSESIGCYADAKNPKGAYGLNQITNLPGVGWKGTPDEYLKLTAEEQLPYIERYYSLYKGKLKTVARLYQVNYLPATIDTVTAPDGVLSGKDGPYKWAYDANPALDPARKGTVTGDDLRVIVEKATTNSAKLWKGTGTFAGRWNEIVSRLGGATAPAAPALLLGSWAVSNLEGRYRYTFKANGDVDWAEADTPGTVQGTGKWVSDGSRVKMTWSLSEESWPVPLNPYLNNGELRRTNGPTYTVTAKKEP